MNPSGKVILVTGAGSGLGRATTRVLLAAGHVVALVGRREEALRETAEDHPRAIVKPADITDPAEVRAVFRTTVAAQGRIDVLFNNAGIFGPSASIDQLDDEDWDAAVAVNVTGSVYCAREAARIMKQQQPSGGRIINNGSLSAHRPRPNSVAYTVTKHAITGLTASLQLDLRAHGIAVTQLDVGNAATAMTRGIQVEALQADGRITAEPTIDAVHVARAVAYIVDLPLDVAVPTMTVMATSMPYAGRG